MEAKTRTTSSICKGELLDKLVALRRDVHQHPEPGFKEFRTQGVIKQMLIDNGVEPSFIKECAGTGLVVDIKGTGEEVADKEVSMVALRADIDALKMTEANPDLPHRSVNEGVAHMCGHDGHLACLLGAGILLSQNRNKIPKNQTVRLLFQPAEEGPGGAPVMIQEGCLDGVNEVYGMHNWPTLPLGGIYTESGPIMAHVSKFEVTVHGKGCHSSLPHTAIDPIVTVAAIVSSLQTIVSRNISYHDAAVLSITNIHGGEAMNVIPDSCRFGGSLRDMTPEVFEKIKSRFYKIVNSTCEAYECTADITFESYYPAVVNHPKETAHVLRIAEKFVGPNPPHGKLFPVLCAEDFAYYVEKIPGCFFYMGTGFQEEGKVSPICHMSNYEWNDSAIPLAVDFWIRLVEDRLAVTLI